MKNSNKRSWLFRPLPLVMIMVIFCTLCVISVRFVNNMPARVSDWDPNALTAERESPDNACHVILEAMNLLPAPPEPLMVPHPGGRKFQMPFWTENGSIAKMVNIERPDDDPLLTQYFDEMDPAVEKLNEALEKPYYLNDAEHYVDHIVHFLIARARHAYEISHDSDRCFDSLLLALKMGALIDQDIDQRGGYSCFHSDTFMKAVYRFTPIMSDTQLKVMQYWLQETRALPFENSHYLQLEWHRLDTILRTYDEEDHIALKIDRWWGKWKLAQAMRRALDEKSYWLEQVGMSYPEFKIVHPYEQMQHGWGDPDSLVNRVLARIAFTERHHSAILLAVALERWQRTAGAYPESLDLLSPDLLESIPQDPYTGTPFGYYREKDRYVLYSYGDDHIDDGGKYAIKQNGRFRGDHTDDRILLVPGLEVNW